MCVSVNMESTSYRIHQASPNANNLATEIKHYTICVCVRTYVCEYMHVCVSVNMESTIYRIHLIHLALPNANNLQR